MTALIEVCTPGTRTFDVVNQPGLVCLEPAPPDNVALLVAMPGGKHMRIEVDAHALDQALGVIHEMLVAASADASKDAIAEAQSKELDDAAHTQGPEGEGQHGEGVRREEGSGGVLRVDQQGDPDRGGGQPPEPPAPEEVSEEHHEEVTEPRNP